MDNIEEIIDNESNNKCVASLCKFHVGDIVWFKSERCYAIVEDVNIATDTDKPVYRVRIAPTVVCSFVDEAKLTKSYSVADNAISSPSVAF